MKNKSLLAAMLLMVTSCVMFVSCDPPIQDWNPINIYIKVSNAEGQNLLDTATPNNFAEKKSLPNGWTKLMLQTLFHCGKNNI